MGWRVDNEVQQMLRESAQGYLGEASGPRHFRAVRDSGSGFDPTAWSNMAQLGWTGILLPESMGGSELGMGPVLTVAEELGRALAPEPFIASAVIAATMLLASTDPAARALASGIADGSRTATLAWQEKRGQLGRPEFDARVSAGKLSGRKVHVPCWHDATAVLVAAAGEQGPVVLLIDPAAAGVVVTTRSMTDGTLDADIDFTNVAIAGDAVVLSGDAAARALDLALARGTLALCAQLEGLAATLWQRTADYIKQRSQFGQPLADYQVLRHRMVDLYAANELAAASWRAAAKALDAGELRGIALHAAKARCSDAATNMGRWAIQYHGAFGYTEEADVGLYVHAGLRWSTWLGNAVAHRRQALVAHERGAAA
jgi:alkylation response protein AidB-like acyl-CoA dehydrogenase